MTKDTPSGKKSKSPRSSKKNADPAAPAEPPLSRVQRARDWMRSASAKGTHDAFAALIKRAWLWGGASVIVLVAALYFGVDLRPWFRWVHHPQLETGSIKKEPGKPIDYEAVKREVECRVAKARELDKLIERRKSAWGVYEKCKTDWKPGWNDRLTAEEVCAPHLTLHRQLKQGVLEREVKDCSTLANR
jgi:hypothetical protein